MLNFPFSIMQEEFFPFSMILNCIIHYSKFQSYKS